LAFLKRGNKGLQVQTLETLKVNCLLFPQSDNAFISYAEALADFAWTLKAEKVNEDCERQDVRGKGFAFN
jgi:hypothetical protein